MRTHPWPTARRASLVRLAAAALLLPLLAGCPADSLRSGGAEGDGVRDDDTALLRGLDGVQDALVTTIPVEDSDYSNTYAAVDVQPGVSADQLATVLDTIAGLEQVGGRTWVTVGAGSVDLDENGELVEATPVPTITGTGASDAERARVAAMLLEAVEMADGLARVTVWDEEVLLQVKTDAPVDGEGGLVDLSLELVARDYLGADVVSVYSGGALRLASADRVLDARAVQALAALVRGEPSLPSWFVPVPPSVDTDSRVEMDLDVDLVEAPLRPTPQERQQVWQWLRAALDTTAALEPGTRLTVSARSFVEKPDPLQLDVAVTVPDAGDPPPDRLGIFWQDRAAAYLHDRARAAGRRG